MLPEVSVIVPVYNVEKYLLRCVESIKKQTFQKIEIILVDDGSVDTSGKMCDELAQQDDRIVVIHKENGGPASARSAGLESASGNYVLFVDSDDWIEQDMIAVFLKDAREYDADMISSGFYREDEGAIVERQDSFEAGCYATKEEKKFLFENIYRHYKTKEYGISPFLWSKFFKRELVEYAFEDLDITACHNEDSAVIYVACSRAEKLYVTHERFYHYYKKRESLSDTTDMTYYKNLNNLYLFMLSKIKQHYYYDVLKKQLDIMFVETLFLGMNYLFGLDERVIIPYCNLPYEFLLKNESIIIYGAGRVGQAYVKQIRAEFPQRTILWMDKNYKHFQEKGLPVISPEELPGYSKEIIVLAVQFEDMAEAIKRELMLRYNIEEKRIVWMPPQTIIDKYCY